MLEKYNTILKEVHGKNITGMFKIGDKVRTLPVGSHTDYANKIYANRNAIVTEICYPFGLHTQYKVKFEEPFYDHGYKVATHYYYDYENGLALRA